jgi:hypothetical protein
MYRTAASGRRDPDTLVVCRACAAPAEVVLDDARDGSYTCRRCKLEQSTLAGADDLGAPPLAYLGHEAGSYTELGELLRSLGREGKCTQIDADCAGIPMKVSLGFNSGTVTGCELVALGKGLVPMRLVREGARELRGKATGVLTEVQTGDAGFDEAVFIETAAAAGDVQTALSSPGVRAAVRRLLEEVPAVVVTESHVKVEVPLSSSTFRAESIRERLAALRVVAGAPRPLVTSHVALPLAVLVTRVLVWTSAPLSIVAVVIGGEMFTLVGPRPWITGLGGGLVVAALLAVVIGRALRGRSTSAGEILRARIATFVTVPMLAMGSLVVVNGAFDPSPERIVEMKVDASWTDDDDASKFQVKARGPDGASHTYSFSGSKPSGPSRVRVPWRSGAFGWTWQTHHAVLVDGAAPP